MVEQGSFIGSLSADQPDVDRRVERWLFSEKGIMELVARQATEFIHIEPDEVPDKINDTLRAVGELTGVDRGYLVRFSDDGATMSITHECVGSK